jgi:uncharacterized membrane protein YdjX (TVP38/TMEM64 family)
LKSPAVRWLLGLALATLVGIALAFRSHFDAAALQAWVEGAGAAGPVVFVVIYAAATVLFLPGAVITLAGGALFGPVWGTLWNLSGATLGALLAFLIARHLGADWVTRRAGQRLRSLNEGVSAEGWRFVAFVRLVPLFPFNLLNYALGITRIPLLQYVVASYICMLPGAIAYTYLGYAGREAVAGGEGLIQKGLLALALLAAVAFLPRLIGTLRKPPMLEIPELKRRLDAGEDVLVLDVRPPDGFTGDLGHIPGVTHIPLNELEQRVHELDAYQDKQVVTICRTDRMSTTAAQLLAQKGFSKVVVAKMGMVDWNKHGYPIEK